MIQELPEKFIGTGEVKGFQFEKVEANDKAYIYKVTIYPIKTNYYEVFERICTPICINFQERIYSQTDFKVRYPKVNDFGIWAWEFRDYKEALRKFNLITKKEKE